MATKTETLERQVEARDKKLDRIMTKGLFIGGIVGGAALGALLDLKFGTIWGFRASGLVGALCIGLVAMDKVPRKYEDEVLAFGLGMAAPTVFDQAKKTIQAGFLKNLLGDGKGG